MHGRSVGHLRRLAAPPAAVLCALALTVAPAQAAPTMVSLEFDDGWATQAAAGPILADRGLHGTFFANSGFAARSGRMTDADLRALQAAGHEIGGHTIDHPHLTALALDDRRREICDDRVVLLAQGLDVRDLAYPYGERDAATERIAVDCGYDSARGVGGGAETLPPADPMATRTPDNVRDTTTLADLQAVVTRAEAAGGGWVQIVFHQLCAGCGPYSADPDLLRAFADWLVPRASAGTTVQTVAAVIGGPLRPGVPGPPRATRAGNLAANPSLEQDADANGVPDCWARAGYGVNTFGWTRTPDARSGAFAERLDIGTLSSGDRKLIPPLDASSCAPAAVPDRTYEVSAAYRSSAPVRIVAYTRDAAGTWTYFAKGPLLPAASAWAAGTWITPPAPAGATAISAGPALGTAGSATFDDLAIAVNLLQNGGLEQDAGGDGVADCWQHAGYGSNTFTWSRTAAAHGGAAAEQLTVSGLASGDRKLVSAFDQGACAPSPTPGHQLDVSGWYRTDGTVRVVLYTQGAAGGWTFWTKGPPLPPSAAWAPASYRTPPVPAGTVLVSAGLALMSTGTATFDDLALFDAG